MPSDAPDFGLRSDELQLVPVGPEWAQRFSSESSRLSAALGSAALDIQHIGSTAIPGICAKPILDIAIAIRSYESGHALVPRFEALGYRYRGENGIPRRHYFVLGAPRRTHHVHVLEHDSDEWRRHLAFRDRLLGSPADAARYSAFKSRCAAEALGCREEYQRLKTPFIEAMETGNILSL
ncbi:GrpB family protein [Tahibacter sp.]|uniref:GrpB family protein n=1 Tax=Tahibacter sp. TaxID=2056211 RepID=UPI0028C467F2|nr:GrpB family protein [Tahibacter sp.]